MIFPREEREGGVSVPGPGNVGGSPPSPEAPPADRLSDYTILEPIGSGLRGTVFRARNKPGRLVALKVFNPGVQVDIETLRRFSPYSDGGIAHPNLVPVEDAGQAEGKAFCSMPFLQGDSLEAILADLRGGKRLRPHLSPLSAGPDGRPRLGFFRHAAILILDVAEGLHKAHDAGVVHGRLSPRNLILIPSGRLMVTDFGAEESRSGGPRRVGGGISHDLHTLPYRAPEQIDDSLPLDRRVDIYALGAILYELITLQPPFSGRDPREVQDAILEGRFLPPSARETRVSHEAEAVVLRAMALYPDDRYATALELAEDLRRLLGLEATEAGAEIRRIDAAGEALERTPDAAVPPPAAPEALESAPESPVPAPEAPPAAGSLPAPESPEMAAAAEALQEAPPADRPPAALIAEALADSLAREALLEPLVIEPPPSQETPETPAPAIVLEESRAAAVPEPQVQPAKKSKAPSPLLTMVLVLFAIGGWTWFTIALFEGGERQRSLATTFSAGLEKLEGAIFALFRDDPSSASSLVSQAVDLGIPDPDLRAIGSALKFRAEDPVLSDLSHPRASLRREAIAALLREVEAAERPPEDLRWIRGSLADSDAAVRAAAIESVARAGESQPILAAYPVGEGLPVLELDGPTFFVLARALADIADGPARATLLLWSFEDFARLDEESLANGEPVEVPPNLRVAPAGPFAECFAAEWIRGRGKIRSREILAIGERLRKGEVRLLGLAGPIIQALRDLGAPEGSRALLGLAEPCSLDHGSRILAALSEIGAAEELLEIARRPLPDSLRARAVGSAAAAMAAQGGPAATGIATGLMGIALRDPAPAVRRAALLGLERLGGASPEVLAESLLDIALREDALVLLDRRPASAALPILLECLRRGDGDLRRKAARAIGAARDPGALRPLAALLLEKDEGVRMAALEALRTISPARTLTLAAGILSPEKNDLLEIATEALRSPFGGETPARIILALRIALGIDGANGGTLALRDAIRAHLREAPEDAGDGSRLQLPPRLQLLDRKR